MLGSVRYAKYIYYNKRREWNKIIDRDMAADFSWGTSAASIRNFMTGSLAKMASLERGVTLMDMPEANEYLMDPGYMECVADILDHPVFQSMDQYIQHGTTTCKCHCIQVSYLAYKLCKRFGGNWRSAARAGLLHDLFFIRLAHARQGNRRSFHGFTHRGQPWKMQNSILN